MGKVESAATKQELQKSSFHLNVRIDYKRSRCSGSYTNK